MIRDKCQIVRLPCPWIKLFKINVMNANQFHFFDEISLGTSFNSFILLIASPQLEKTTFLLLRLFHFLFCTTNLV